MHPHTHKRLREEEKKSSIDYNTLISTITTSVEYLFHAILRLSMLPQHLQLVSLAGLFSFSLDSSSPQLVCLLHLYLQLQLCSNSCSLWMRPKQLQPSSTVYCHSSIASTLQMSRMRACWEQGLLSILTVTSQHLWGFSDTQTIHSTPWSQEGNRRLKYDYGR